MPGFALPADFRSESLSAIAVANTRLEMPVREVYGNLNPSPYGSGRLGSVLPVVSRDRFIEYVDCAANAGIEFNYTLNFSSLANREYTPEGRASLRSFLEDLAGIGVHRFTVALPTFLDLFDGLDARVTISTIAAIQSPVAARLLEKYPAVDRVCIPESLNRDLRKVELLRRQIGLDLSALVNSFCLLQCPFRAIHYDYESHAVDGPGDEVPCDFLGRLCDQIRQADQAMYVRSPWIRPEEMDRYLAAGINLFKLGGRELPQTDFLRTVEAFNARRYDGDIVDLLLGFSSARGMYPVRLDNRSLDELMASMLARTAGCHPLECPACGLCERWSVRHLHGREDARQDNRIEKIDGLDSKSFRS